MARTAQIGRLRALLLAGDDTDRRAARTALTQTVLAALAGRELCAGARREQAVRQGEIRRLAVAVGQARQQLRDNRAQLLAMRDVTGLPTPYAATRIATFLECGQNTGFHISFQQCDRCGVRLPGAGNQRR